MPSRAYCRLLPLLLAMVLALGACGRIGEAEETTAVLSTLATTVLSTTEAPTTTVPETTTEPKRPIDTSVHDLGDGASWRVVDLEAPEGKAERDWLLAWQDAQSADEDDPKEYPIAGGKTVFEGYLPDDNWTEPRNGIVLRDRDGKETLLLTHHDANSEAQPDPQIVCVLGDRFVLCVWENYGVIFHYGIYDTRKMTYYDLSEDTGRRWRVLYNNEDPYAYTVYQTHDNRYIYFCRCDGELLFFRMDWRGMERDKAPTAEEYCTLPYVGRSQFFYLNNLISPNAQYFAVPSMDGIALYDLRNLSKAWHIPHPSDTTILLFNGTLRPSLLSLVFIDDHTLYMHNKLDTPYLVEITLP